MSTHFFSGQKGLLVFLFKVYGYVLFKGICSRRYFCKGETAESRGLGNRRHVLQWENCICFFFVLCVWLLQSLVGHPHKVI